MFKVGVCGHFGFKYNLQNGQTIKTKILTQTLKNILGEKSITNIDTHDWRKKPFHLIYLCFSIIKNSKNIIILPASNGINVFVPLFIVLNTIFKKKVFYVVIGGWLPSFLRSKKFLVYCLRKYNKIFVETKIMQKKLLNLGLNNVAVMPNFKELIILKTNEIPTSYSVPFKLCTFSRVSKEKGIEDAIDVIKKINSESNAPIVLLDIYGQIDRNYEDKFNIMLKNLPPYIKYKGIVPFDKSVETLKDYFLLLFPTYYEGEGFAGSLLDAFAAALPTIASDWHYNSEIINDNKTGKLFKAKDLTSFKNTLIYYIENPQEVVEMKGNCLEMAEKYMPENAIKILLDNLELNYD